MLTKNDTLKGSFFKTVVSVSKVHQQVTASSYNQTDVHKSLNKASQLLTKLCDDEDIPKMCKTNVSIKNFAPIPLGLTREALKEELCIEASYNKKARKEYEDKKLEEELDSRKSNIKIFGYKHPKVNRFIALILKCLKDCCEQKAE